jgi:hypothetical protein
VGATATQRILTNIPPIANANSPLAHFAPQSYSFADLRIDFFQPGDVIAVVCNPIHSYFFFFYFKKIFFFFFSLAVLPVSQKRGFLLELKNDTTFIPLENFWICSPNVAGANANKVGRKIFFFFSLLNFFFFMVKVCRISIFLLLRLLYFSLIIRLRVLCKKIFFFFFLFFFFICIVMHTL